MLRKVVLSFLVFTALSEARAEESSLLVSASRLAEVRSAASLQPEQKAQLLRTLGAELQLQNFATQGTPEDAYLSAIDQDKSNRYTQKPGPLSLQQMDYFSHIGEEERFREAFRDKLLQLEKQGTQPQILFAKFFLGKIGYPDEEDSAKE